MVELLSSFGKQGASLGLDHADVDFDDTAYLSRYFNITELTPVFTAGKNSVSFNGSSFLKEGSNIFIECLDADDNSLFIDSPAVSAHYMDMAKFTITISVFRETVNGTGKLIFVGTTVDDEYVRWSTPITINNTLPNVSRTRFYNAPTMEVRSLLFPVINSDSGTELTSDSTISGSFSLSITTPAGSVPQCNIRSPVRVFNSQMVGTIIQLEYFAFYLEVMHSELVNYNTPEFRYQNKGNGIVIIYKRTTTNATILKVISPYTVQISPIINNTYGRDATFTITYNQTSQIGELVPILSGSCTGFAGTSLGITYATNQQVPVTNHYMIGIINNAFSQSMIGKSIAVTSTQIIPKNGSATNYTSTHVAKLVTLSTNNHTASIDVPFVWPDTFGFNEQVNIIAGTFVVTEQPLNAYQNYSSSNGTSSIVQKSYAEIIYRNIKTFSGVVTRHKLYAKSNIYPGDYEILADSTIEPYEFLTDPITADKTYANIGQFTTQDQVNKYWFTNNPTNISITQTDSPIISSLYISAQPSMPYPTGMDYVIVKTSALNVINNAIYYPYDLDGFVNFSGSSYASNFINLKANTFYKLSTNLAVEKSASNINAKVSFYFTSSDSNIKKEKNYREPYGLFLGEVLVPQQVSYKLFSDTQEISFTPNNDYYGTLVIVPYQCNVILSNLSLKNYGDYGYSPDTGFIRIPFPINVANEAFTIKAELYDINSNLVYTINPQTKAFDQYGASLYGSNILGSSGVGNTPSTLPVLTVTGDFKLPNISTCPNTNVNRVIGINLTDGVICATNIINLDMISSPSTNTYKDYIELNTANPTLNGRSLIIHYSGSLSEGRRIFIAPNGVKTIFQ